MTTKLFFTLILISSVSFAANEKDLDFDSLGGNKTFLDKAQAIAPDQNVSVVQNRMVKRDGRVEIAPEFSGSFGGDTYSRTRSLGMNLNYHFNPRWSVGLKYNYSFNDLTPEGKAAMDRAYEDYQKDPGNPNTPYPEVDYPKQETMALVNWYPFYGKMSLFEKAVAHFDFYFIGGYGQVGLKSGNTSTYTGGAGFGFWVNQNFTTRLEMRYQNYKAKSFDGDKSMDLAIAGVQMGWML